MDYNKFNIYAIDGLKGPLQTFNSKITEYVKNHWNNNNINMMFDNFVQKVDDKKIYFKNNQLEYDLVIWCGGIKNTDLTNIICKKLEFENRFGLQTDDYLQVKNVDDVFAVGDCANSKYPPTAQNAFQQGKYLANSFNNNLDNMKKYDFVSKGQIGYIGNNQSVYQNEYFSTYGNTTYFINNIVHLYNSISMNQMYNIFFKK